MCVSTGNQALDIGLGVAVGAATGGLSAPLTAAETASASIFTLASHTAVGGALIGGVGSAITSNLFTPPEIPDFPQQTTPVAFQSNQTIATTGSGGGQASASLAEAIKRTKKRKLTQQDVGDLSIDTSSFASSGLQLA
jgi:hypothetical protein